MTKRSDFIWGLAFVFWTTVIGLFAWHEISSDYEMAIEHAGIEARASYNKDLVYRRWAASHGGVYVPVTEATPPNPYLDHVPERDLVTPSGRRLTLLNPAYMTRQVHALGNEQYGVKGHLTSLNPINPVNMPDAWETQSLEAFKQGSRFEEAVSNIDSQAFYRVMYPMVVEEGCLKCHEQQGYTLGDLRGGISVSVPLSPYLSLHQEQLKKQVVYHSGIWLFGLFGLLLSRKIINRQLIENKTALEKTLESSDMLQRQKLGFEKAQELGKVGHWDLDLTQDKLIWSDEICRIFDVPPGTVLNYEAFLEKVHPDDREYVDREWQSAKKSRNYDIEHRLLINGEVKWVREKAEFLFNGEGQLEGALGFTQDITTRKANEAKIIESEEKFRVLYDDSPLPFHSLDENGCFIEVNPAWLRLLGYRKDEVIGRYAGEFLHPDWVPLLPGRFQEFKRAGKVQNVHFRMKHKAGHYIDISLGGCLSYNPDGSFRNTNCVFTDITDRIKAEEERAEMEAQAIRSAQLATLGELAAGVAHEINNPISGVINYAQIILNKCEPGSSAIDLSQRIMKEGNRIATIVSKLLSFSRKEEGEHRYCRLRELIETPLALIGKKLEHDGIHINISINDISEINCNPQQVEQVLLNLISNAQYALNKKYPQGSENKKIDITARKICRNEKNLLSLEVFDAGIGISEQNLPKIFKAFYTTKEAEMGTGLGMSISENIIKLHEGTIRVESKEGEFTRVIVELPFVR